MQQNAATVNSTAWRVEGSLREFPNFKPVNCWFNYPIHEIDTKGVLSSTFVEGSRDVNLSKSGKRKQTKETRKEELDDAFTAVCMGKKSKGCLTLRTA
jgi:RecA-family ATPase